MPNIPTSTRTRGSWVALSVLVATCSADDSSTGAPPSSSGQDTSPPAATDGATPTDGSNPTAETDTTDWTDTTSDGSDPNGPGSPNKDNVAEWQSDPCLTPQITPSGYTRVDGTDGNDTIDRSSGTGKHFIVAGPGNDKIFAGPGDDIVCAGAGKDIVYGQEGNDYIDGGFGNDELSGNNGLDVIHGRAGSDKIWGGAANDALFGDILDDEIYGEAGNDLVVGGHGTDYMHGGEGDDWLRGDTNGDEFVGGAGKDTASFSTATPPGPTGPEGVDVYIKTPAGKECKGEPPSDPSGSSAEIAYPGCSWGDGTDGLMGVESVVGSHFADHFHSDLATKVDFFGGYGDDFCGDSPCITNKPAPQLPVVFVDLQPRDLGVVFLGSAQQENVLIERNELRIRVIERNGQPLFVGAGCYHTDPNTLNVVECEILHTIRYVLAWGGAGNDTIEIGGSFPRDFTAYLDGGQGDDILHGGPGQDQMTCSEPGRDEMYGHAGDDALISESDDGDLLSGGEDNDQLVTNNPCGGHEFIGGSGQDIAGFARVGVKKPVHAQLGGKAEGAGAFHGYAMSPGTCEADKSRWTRLADDLEILEGGDLNDVLWGNDAANTIWGREGDDEIRGFGGDDILEGHMGKDELFGGPGRDIIRGSRGYDKISAADGEVDIELDCGEDGGKILTRDDKKDPNATNCD